MVCCLTGPNSSIIILREMTALGRRFLFLMVFSLLPSSCNDGKPKELRYEVDGTEAQRIEGVRNILQKNVAILPTLILDPHFVQEQTGDGKLGPSDFRSFFAFRVPKGELGKWTSLFGDLKLSNDPPLFVSPKESETWWVSTDQFPGLRFYSPRALTGRSNGWIGVDFDSGEIFIYTFTM